MKKAFVVLAIVLALFAGQAYANYCARDIVPAASLLVPFAQQGLAFDGKNVDPQGKATLFEITNVSNEAQIVHITVWNMFSQHVVDFDIILTGYDAIEINFRDILNGDLDLMATPAPSVDKTKYTSVLQVLGDYIPYELGPDGRGTVGNEDEIAEPGETLPYPQDRDIFAGTTGCDKFPYGKYPSLASCWRDKIAWPLASLGIYDVVHSNASGSNDWLSNPVDSTSNLYFYITADVVNRCSVLFPDEATYWVSPGTPQGVIGGRNVLVGDIIYFDAKNNYSEALPAQHMEWDTEAGLFPNAYYQRYADLLPTTSFFEPLGTAMSVRFQNDDMVKTNLWFFKASATLNNGYDANDFNVLKSKGGTCDNEGWKYFLEIDDENGYTYYSWDMDEYPASVTTGICPVSPCPDIPLKPNVLPFETQTVAIDDNNFDLSGSKGWMLFVLPPSYNFTGEPCIEVGCANMGWAGVQFTFNTGGNNYSAAMEAATIANANCFTGQVSPWFGINYDYLPLM